MSGTMTDLIGDNPQDLLANAKAMLVKSGAPMTAENLNRAVQMVHGSRTDGTDFIMDQVDAADSGATSIARPRSRTQRQAANQPPPSSPRAPSDADLPTPPAPIGPTGTELNLTGETAAPTPVVPPRISRVLGDMTIADSGEEAAAAPSGARDASTPPPPRMPTGDEMVNDPTAQLMMQFMAGSRSPAMGRVPAPAAAPRVAPTGPAIPPQAAPATATPSSYVDDIIASNPTSAMPRGGPVGMPNAPGGVPGRSDPLLTGPHFGPRPTGIPGGPPQVGGPGGPRMSLPTSPPRNALPAPQTKLPSPARSAQTEVQRRVAEMLRRRKEAGEPTRTPRARSERRNAASSR